MKPQFPLIDFLDEMAGRPGATDITLCSNGRVGLRQNARMAVMTLAPLKELWAETMAGHFRARPADPRCSCTVVLSGQKGARFRAMLAASHEGETLSVRFLAASIRSPSELLLPSGLEDRFTRLRGGLFLVCGPSGSGKSTTIASLLRSRGAVAGGKTVSIENPVELVHESMENCLFVQRELGESVRSYSEGLEEALQMNPDVISVQELREPAAAETALSAALSGHLVIASIHATTASTAPQRFLSLINPSLDDAGARDALASCLEGVVMQRLVPGYDRLVPVFEVLLLRDGAERLHTVERLVRQGNWLGLRQEMEGGRHGMMTLEESLRQRTEEGLIAGASWATGGTP
ncbi:MAG: ATPase, T2SS/T4P/T4SS family [Opitutaceae bacterium]|jgi:twitching motility protein PilT